MANIRLYREYFDMPFKLVGYGPAPRWIFDNDY